MNRQVLKSNSAFVAIGDSPAWKTTEDTARLFQLVQGCNFSITNERQKLKQIGKEQYAVNHIVRAPQPNLNLSYYLSPFCSNEIMLGFEAIESEYTPCVKDLNNRDHNIYVIIDPEDTRDAFDDFKKSPSTVNFSGKQALTFGNCFLNSYSVSFNLNSVPVVDVGFSASNLRFENITGGRISIPAINSVSGNNIGSGFLNLSGLYNSLTDGYVSNYPNSGNEFNPPVALSNNSSFKLNNLQVGGIRLDTVGNPILQSFDLSLDLSRTDLYGLGSNYVYNRKLEYPVNGKAGISCLVSGISSGQFQSILTNESGYSFEVSFCDSKKLVTGFYKIENAKLESLGFSSSINNIFTFNADFSFEANQTGGFFIKRSTSLTGIWDQISEIWNNININWDNI